jgi:hypothetical protein
MVEEMLMLFDNGLSRSLLVLLYTHCSLSTAVRLHLSLFLLWKDIVVSWPPITAYSLIHISSQGLSRNICLFWTVRCEVEQSVHDGGQMRIAILPKSFVLSIADVLLMSR